MKINKKVFIPAIATAMGLSVIGGIAGAVAWYQYNSKVSTSFAGATVADTGVLQIGQYQPVVDNQGQPVYVDPNAENPVQQTELVWGRDIVQPDIDRLVPVTFGALEEQQVAILDDQNQPVDADGDGENDYITKYVFGQNQKAYAYPEAGCGEGYNGHTWTDAYGKEIKINGWSEARKGIDYAQFDFYMKAVQIEGDEFVQVERDVFLSDYIFRSISGNTKFAHEALRVHIAANDGVDGAVLLANKEYKVEHSSNSTDPDVDKRLPLYGPLDLDRSNRNDADPLANENDVYHSTIWNDELKAYGVHPDTYGTQEFPSTDPTDPSASGGLMAGAAYRDGEVMSYGNYGEKQSTESFENMIQTRDQNTGMMPRYNEAGYTNKLFTLKADAPTKITVTVWLEGWEPLTTDGTNTDASKDALWNPEYTAETSIQVGLQFDTGIFRGEDLTDLSSNNSANPSNPQQP